MLKTLVASALAAATLAPAAAAAGPPAFPRIPGPWSHAELNVSFGGQPHTLVLDRGRLGRVGPMDIVVREADGSRVDVQLSPTTRIVVNGRRATVLQLRPGMRVETLAVDGGPAVRVRAGRR